MSSGESHPPGTGEATSGGQEANSLGQAAEACATDPPMPAVCSGSRPRPPEQACCVHTTGADTTAQAA